MTTQTRVMLGGTDHTTVARQMLNELFRTEGGRPGLLSTGGDFWAWTGGRWTVRPRQEIEKSAVEWMEDALVKAGEDEEGRPLFTSASQEFSARDIREILWIVERMATSATQSFPRWLEKGEWPDPDYCIAFKDKIVDIKGTMALRREGNPGYVTLPRDDRFFSPGVLTTNFTPEAECPTWVRCQEEWSGGDPVWQEVRERAYGLALSFIRNEGRGLLEQGKTQSGKGTGTNDVLSKLLMRPAYHSATMHQIVEGFGLDGLHQCQVWVTSEVQDLDRGKGAQFATLWKMVLGRDQSMVNIKNVRQLKGVTFRCFPIMQSNPMPNFPDDAGAVTSKLIVLPFRHSFADRRDNDLPDKLGRELPGIAARFTEALVRLQMSDHKDRWPLVKGAAEILAQISLEGNPIDAFLKWGFTRAEGSFVTLDYIVQKRAEFESEMGIVLRGKDRKRIPNTQLLYHLETQSTWPIHKTILRNNTPVMRGLGLKAII